MVRDKLTIIKVLYARPHIGGSGLSGTDLALELAKIGHEVHIVSYPNTYLTPEQAKLINIHSAPDFSYFGFKIAPVTLTFPGIIRLIAEEKGIDVLHAHYGVPHGEAVIDARDIIIRDMDRGKLPNNRRKPIVVISNRGTDISINGYEPVLAPGIGLHLSKADGITFVSASLQEEAKKIFDLDDYGIVIPNFVNEEIFKRSDSDVVGKRLRKQLGIPTGAVVFYHISNFRQVKNVDVIIEAYNELINQLNLTNTRLLMIGDGPEKINAENKVKKYGLFSYVIFTGTIPPEEVIDYTQVGEVLVLPSIEDACPRAALEAMHLGNAILAANSCGLPEIVQHGLNGYLLDPHDAHGLARYMLKLANDRSLMKRMGASGKEIVGTKFNRRRIFKQYEELYYQLLNETNAT